MRRLKVNVVPDQDPVNPRKEWDNLGTLVAWHRRYDIADGHTWDTPEEFREWWKSNGRGGVLLPVYLYDHSGLRVATAPFSCPWDSGQVGFIYVEREKILREKITKETARKVLEGEIETLDHYLSGSVYGYEVVDEDTEEVVDSCSGFFGDEEEARAEGEAAKKFALDVDAEGEKLVASSFAL